MTGGAAGLLWAGLLGEGRGRCRAGECGGRVAAGRGRRFLLGLGGAFPFCWFGGVFGDGAGNFL